MTYDDNVKTPERVKTVWVDSDVKHSLTIDSGITGRFLICSCGWASKPMIREIVTNEQIRLAKIEHVLEAEGLME